LTSPPRASLPLRLDDGGEAVAAQVRAVVVEDRRLALALGVELEDAADVGAGHAAGELAIGKGAGPALAEEVVALRVVRPAAVEGADVMDPLVDWGPAFQDQGLVSLLGQEVGGGEAGGAGADDDGVVLQRHSPPGGQYEGLFFVGRHLDGGLARRPVLEHAGLVGQIDLGGVDEGEVVGVAGVETLAEDAPVEDVGGRNAQLGREVF
jgi:hypothetical protein